MVHQETNLTFKAVNTRMINFTSLSLIPSKKKNMTIAFKCKKYYDSKKIGIQKMLRSEEAMIFAKGGSTTVEKTHIIQNRNKHHT
jgi:hypothetical protein